MCLSVSGSVRECVPAIVSCMCEYKRAGEYECSREYVRGKRVRGYVRGRRACDFPQSSGGVYYSIIIH